MTLAAGLTNLLAVLAACGTLTAREYSVAPDGEDHSASETRPFKTIQAAVDRLQPGDTLTVHSGIYRETVTLTRGGTRDRAIVIRAAAGAAPLVTGCDRIAGWRLHNRDKNIWSAPMEWTLGKGRDQVFVNGEVMIEARYPDEAEEGLGMYVSGLSPLWPTFAALSIADPVSRPGRITGRALEKFPTNHWQGACYYGVHYQGWCAQTGIIESSAPGEIEVGDRTRTWWFGPAYGGTYTPEEGRGMIVGHMNALNRPGEWHREEDTLYLIPPEGISPQEALIEAKRRQLAFDLSGQSHIHIRDLTIKAASLRLDGSAHCTVTSCDLSYISHFTRHYAMGQIEQGRDTIRSGETGIFVGGRDNAFLNCTVRHSAGAGFHLRGYHHTIHNCLIDEINYCSHYLNAITDAVTDFLDYEHFLVGGHVITYNTMRNAGRHFFNFYGNGCSKLSRDRAPMDYMATLFAHNHLYNGMLQTRDAGFLTGYYCSGGTLNALNSQVCYNVMHDCYDIFGMRINVLGIVYLDAGTCDVELYNNLLWAAPGSHQRGLWFNTMCVDVSERDNLFHPEFKRNCATLRSRDFPGARPFRFGCDHASPPPLPRWPQLEEECIELHPDTDLSDGSCLELGTVDFDRGWQSAVIAFAADTRTLNTDRSARASPRHRQPTDPLVLEAADRDASSPGIQQRWTFIHSITNGAWIKFSQVPMGAGHGRFRAVYGSTSDLDRWIEVRLDRIDGPLVSRAALPRTDTVRDRHIQIYAEATAEVSAEAHGTRDLYLVFRAADALPVGEFEYFRFEQYRGTIDLRKNDVLFELRTDAPDGRKIGEFYPRFTGGADTYRDMVASLEPVTGKRPLFLRIRSTLDAPAGHIRSLTLQKAAQTIDWSGIGEPPRRRWWGGRVLPEPTHPPRARPDEQYAATRNYTDAQIAAMKLPRLKSPLQIEGIRLWFDAADTATITTDESGNVSLWRDRSGGELHAGQSNPAHRPLFDKNGLDGRPALRFSEERSTRLELPDISSNRTTVTVFAVLSNPVPGSERNHNPRILTASDGSEYDYKTGIALTVPGMETGGPRLQSGVFRDRWAGRVRIGCFSPHFQTFFTGCISEIILYDRPLTPQEQFRIKAYLTRKWNL